MNTCFWNMGQDFFGSSYSPYGRPTPSAPTPPEPWPLSANLLQPWPRLWKPSSPVLEILQRLMIEILYDPFHTIPVHEVTQDAYHQQKYLCFESTDPQWISEPETSNTGTWTLYGMIPALAMVNTAYIVPSKRVLTVAQKLWPDAGCRMHLREKKCLPFWNS